MKNIIYLFILCTFISFNKQEERGIISQTKIISNNWEFSEHNKNKWLPATVPGSVHIDLFNNGIIEDPFFENNEIKQRWIENKNWSYKTEFTVDSVNLSAQRNNLKFNGLDTYAKVYLNDRLIVTANNMFRTWEVSVHEILHLGKNELRIEFESPILHNKKGVENYPYTLPSGNESADIETKVSNFTRKATYHFGWDWGPRFVTQGIWKPIELIDWNYARITDVYTSTKSIVNNIAELESQIEIETIEAGNYVINIDGVELKKKLKVGINIIKHSVKVRNPKLWNPNKLGEPYLYNQIVFLTKKGTQVDYNKSQFGIRTIQLINEPDSIGTSFYFNVNGKPLFMKGANYIPQDIFLSRVTPAKYEVLLTHVKDLGMNMIRVWGGGIYEREIFYDLCDKYGILVWQDFMFAGSLYPNNKELTDNITQEVIENIKRLRNHPSLAIWCGNNEQEVAWKNWGWQKRNGYSSEDSTIIWNHQLYLFRDLIPRLVAEYSPSISYTPTSPLSNWGTAENFNHSSMHYWGVWHGKETFESFEKNVGRFMVEYGFQSFPEIATLKKVMHDSSLYLNSVVMKNRQKSYIGNGLIEKHINQYYDTTDSFEEFVLLSQKTQEKALRMAIKAHISQQPHCMGTLFCQLNDCWPGPSWSIIDYYGNEKVAYNSVKVAFN